MVMLTCIFGKSPNFLRFCLFSFKYFKIIDIKTDGFISLIPFPLCVYSLGDHWHVFDRRI